MEETVRTIGLQDLLDEVSRDLDEYRKKHATDYGVKNVTLWWELQKERLLLRHAPTTKVKLSSRLRKWRREIAWFLAGSGTHLAVWVTLWMLLS
jgi:hypothetical protein